ncbi:MAG: putative bifunctional diguanylate cyclase/phosphodiesterase [Steroidobacteraceae bacterium]
MGSFRNRLLALIIALVVVTESVTLVAVLARTERDVQAQAADRLHAGASIADQLIQDRTTQLTATADVLAADYGFREAFTSGDAATMLSAAQNHSARIGADLVVLSDLDGHVLASTAPGLTRLPDVLRGSMFVDAYRNAAHPVRFALLNERLYQLVAAPVRAPEQVGWAVMGFLVNDSLAARIRDLVGAQVTFLATTAQGHALAVASTLPPELRPGLTSAQYTDATLGTTPMLKRLGSERFLSAARSIDSKADVRILLQTSMADVLRTYYAQRDGLLLISMMALALAVAIAVLLGRSAARPIGELVRAAQRVRSGAYQTRVRASGGKEFRSLADTFNAMQQDIAEREARILHDAYHDALTGLANLAGAERSLGSMLESAPSVSVALILVELRNVREIGSSLGHHTAHDALREVARRLQQNVASGDVAARIAAHQFLVLSPGCSPERAPIVADQLCAIVRTPYHLPSISLELHAAAGVCWFPEHGGTAAELLQRVQIALDDAEELRTRTGIYRSGRAEQYQRRLALVSGLRQAMAKDQLHLVYQPKVTIQSRSIRSFEALVRWTHPDLGPISPAEFVPLAESTGGSRALSSWVLRAAIRQLAQWHGESFAVDVAVNLSAPDILDATLVDEVLHELETHGVEPSRLVLEITESAVMRDAQLAARHMQLLRASGVRFAIDDFGTGFSSLSQLARLPLDELKIDRSFVQRVHERRGDAAIVRSTIELAHSLGLKVVAEGVETAEGWNLLRQLDCDYAQGYFISKPLPETEVASFVRKANEMLPASDSTVRQIRALGELRSAQNVRTASSREPADR